MVQNPAGRVPVSDIRHPLMDLPKFGEGPGLRRVETLVRRLDAMPQPGRCIVVTGSNGKGSTARITAQLLRAEGGDVGLFTSPHLYRYHERFRIDGIPADEAELLAVMDEVQAAMREPMGAFEAQFAVALTLFARRRVRWLVLEAGIGGRYDPVRVVRAPLTALVSLDLEHAELLGNTLQEIAFDKLDATAPGGKAILGPSCLPLEADIRAYASLSGIEIAFATQGLDRGIADGWQHFDLPGFANLRSRLIGRHQIDNHAVALTLCRERLGHSLPEWRQAIEQVEWPGRLEGLGTDIWIDVGHSPAAVEAALAGFLSLGRDATLVTGASKNKNARAMLRILAPRFARIVCTRAHHNGMDAREIEALVREANPAAETIMCPGIEDAVKAVRAHPAYVAGGLFLAAEFACAWRGGDPRDLRFF
jgi:dihydrofolate synthase/folylpolyglutamate synthase